MGILKYHQPLISYERGWPLACLDGLIKPNQTSHQGARWTPSVSILKVPVLAIETSAVWPWCRRSFQDICRGLDNYSWAYLWFISHDLSHGVPLMLSKHTDMTIHWKALEEHFLMVTLVFQFDSFFGRKCIFLIFSQKTSVLKKELKRLVCTRWFLLTCFTLLLLVRQWYLCDVSVFHW
jgi:hypothetical protein